MPGNTPASFLNLFNPNNNSTTTTTPLYSILPSLRITDFFHSTPVGGREGEGESLSRGRWVENSPTFAERVMRGELTVTRTLLDNYNPAKHKAEEDNFRVASRRGVRISIRSRQI